MATDSVCMGNIAQHHPELILGCPISWHKHVANTMCQELVALNGGFGGLSRGHFFKGKGYYAPKGIRLQIGEDSPGKHGQADRNSKHLLATLATGRSAWLQKPLLMCNPNGYPLKDRRVPMTRNPSRMLWLVTFCFIRCWTESSPTSYFHRCTESRKVPTVWRETSSYA